MPPAFKGGSQKELDILACDGLDSEVTVQSKFVNNYNKLFDRVHLAISNELVRNGIVSSFRHFSIEGVLSYDGFCDDFGPMSLGTIYHFCTILDKELQDWPDHMIAMIVSEGDKRALTNAVFLMGAYMIARLNFTLDHAISSFRELTKHTVAYRDVCPGHQNFDLYLEDCLAGLYRAKQLGWVQFDHGGFDPSEYAHYDNPLNADLHQIVPGKFIAMKGPESLPNGGLWEDTTDAEGSVSHRIFSPAHCANILQRFGVKLVMRLNEPKYRKAEFAAAGIAVADLIFDDCSAPPPEVVAKFLALADGFPGVIAVHCKAGLGRTGTLIALYMMKAHRFTAREAIGWIRIVRPGSVIGTQQSFLCNKEELMHRAHDCKLPTEVLRDTALTSVQRFIAATAERIDVQSSKFRWARRAQSAGSCDPRERCRKGESSRQALAEHVSVSSDARSGLRAARLRIGSAGL